MFGFLDPAPFISKRLRSNRTSRQVSSPIRRSRVASWWDGKQAVHSSVSLPDYLIFRHRKYLEQLPQDQYPLPFIPSAQDNVVTARPNPMADRHPLHRFMENPSETAGIDEGDPLAARVRWLGAQNETERQVILRELQAFEEETAQLTARWMEETERLDDQIAALQKEINEGEASAFRQPSRLGRPRLPYTWKLRGCVALIVCLLFCEAWQFAIPYYNQIGINISNLSAEWRRNPMGIITGIGFAVGAFACLFGCAHLIFKLSLSIYNDRLQGEKR